MKFGMITLVGSSVFLGRYDAPSQVAGPSVAQILRTSCMGAHSIRNNNHVLNADQTRCVATLYAVDHES